MARDAPRPLVRSAAGRPPAGARATTTRSGARLAADAVPRRWPRWSPTTACWWPTTRGSTGSPRRSRRSSTPSRPTPPATPARSRATRWRSPRGSGSTPPASRPAPRRPAARHRQARRLQPHPRQAGAARPTTSCAAIARPPALHARDPGARAGFAPTRGRRGRAPRAARRPRLPPRSGGSGDLAARRACWPSPTSTRR